MLVKISAPDGVALRVRRRRDASGNYVHDVEVRGDLADAQAKCAARRDREFDPAEVSVFRPVGQGEPVRIGNSGDATDNSGK